MTLRNRVLHEATASGSNLSQIGPCDEPRIFTLAQANELAPLLRSITGRTHQALQTARNRMAPQKTTESDQAESSCQHIVEQWVAKMERLGMIVRGLWLLDMDTGDGYLCWKHPESVIFYYRDYGENFSKRRCLQEVIRAMSPDWADCNQITTIASSAARHLELDT